MFPASYLLWHNFSNSCYLFISGDENKAEGNSIFPDGDSHWIHQDCVSNIVKVQIQYDIYGV